MEEAGEPGGQDHLYCVVTELRDRIAADYNWRGDSILRLFNELLSAISLCDFTRAAEVCLYLAAKPRQDVTKILDQYGNRGKDADQV